MNTIRILPTILSALFLTSCATRFATAPPLVLTSSDTVIVHKNITHTPESIYIPLPAETLSILTRDTVSVLSTRYACSRAAVDSLGHLSHTLLHLQTSVPATVTRTTIFRDSIITRTRHVPVPTPIPLTRYQQLAITHFGKVVLILLALLAFIIIPTLHRFIRQFHS